MQDFRDDQLLVSARLFYYGFNTAFCLLEIGVKFFFVDQDVISTYRTIPFMLYGGETSASQATNNTHDDGENDDSSPYGFSEMAVITTVFTVGVTAVMLAVLLIRLAVYHVKHQPPAYRRIVPRRAVR